jgi:hypothetical protein
MVLLHVSGTDPKIRFLFECTVDSMIDDATEKISLICHCFAEFYRLAENESLLPSSPPNRKEKLARAIRSFKERFLEIERPIKFPDVYEEIGKLRELEFEHLEQIDRSVATNQFHESTVKDQVLWWAGKPICTSASMKSLSDYIGTNDKTKLIVSIHPKSSPPPVRHGRIDTETYKNILSYYQKRSETSRQLENDEDDSYLVSDWADSRQLKHSLSGTRNSIQWRI